MADSSEGSVASLRALSNRLGFAARDPRFASHLDEQDELRDFKGRFLFPRVKPAHQKDNIYMVGNSLGLQPRTTRAYLNEELDHWHHRAVTGHFVGERPWRDIDETVHGLAAQIVGASPQEVAIMNSLTVNLHLMMIHFYRPVGSRCKILLEAHAFPSDRYAIESQIKLHGLDPKQCFVEVSPRPGESTLRTADILAHLERNKEEIALMLFSGVQYYTGQLFDIPKITEAAHKVGALVGWDLAHAVGNVVLRLHDWSVDFAVWCSYKYLNAGPGAIGGCFVHDSHSLDVNSPRLAGWWGHELKTRFTMTSPFHPIPGALGFRLSNPCVLSVTALRASLEIFCEAKMERLQKKSRLLTGYLELLLREELRFNSESTSERYAVITPSNEAERGAHLSLFFPAGGVDKIEHALQERGVLVDIRTPSVIRVAPAPLYTSFDDVRQFVAILKETLETLQLSK